MKNFKLVQLVKFSLLAAVSYVLMFFSFPIIPFAPFLKLDLSDLPILVGGALFGPLAGIIIALIKVIMYWITFGASLPSLIGVFASFMASISILLPMTYGLKNSNYQLKLTKSISVVALETIVLTIVLAIMNWLVITPLYINLIGLKIAMPIIKYVLLFIVPFNLVKGIIIGTLFVFIYSHWLKKIK